MDYAKLGLKAGLEVHQQLDTGKLFIRTPSTLTDEFDFTIQRKLRPVASELGEYDKTAIDAFKRNETFYYSGKKDNISLVELDEEPPQPLDEDALKTVLEVALLCKSKTVDEAVAMRKTVIDGSNTSAFQRTMMISLGGLIEIKSDIEKTGKKKIGVQTIILEEDAARPIKKEQGKIYYNLDRLGIPLIELATDPDIRSPFEAIETAKKIGELLRLTCKTKRGKGTIRQDVNVSIAEGARCEIKGCQELELIGTVVEKEIERQIDLLTLKGMLKTKFKTEKERLELFGPSQDITRIFTNSECKFIKGKTAFAMKIIKMKGLLGQKVGAKRFGSELSAYAKATGVSGLLHRDELPNYGMTQKEVDDVCSALKCTSEDNFVIIVAEKERAEKAFEAITRRTLIAFEKIPSETRGALEDGSSEYQRPLSGEARMYPETDIPVHKISDKYLLVLEKGLPKSVTEREKAYTAMGISTNHVEEMKLSNYARFFEESVALGANPKISAGLLLQTLTELRRNKIATEKVKLEDIREILLLEAKGKISKSALADAVKVLASGATVEEILAAQSEKKVDNSAVEKIVALVVAKNITLVKSKGMGAIGPLMGDLTKEPALNGVDGKVLSDLLRKEIIAQK
ncbi:MAG: Glu-tRNA(Gln) amidotransferase subunit GatE [archaeon]